MVDGTNGAQDAGRVLGHGRVHLEVVLHALEAQGLGHGQPLLGGHVLVGAEVDVQASTAGDDVAGGQARGLEETQAVLERVALGGVDLVDAVLGKLFRSRVDVQAQGAQG